MSKEREALSMECEALAERPSSPGIRVHAAIANSTTVLA
jgi:hypothetical protein